MHRRILCCLVLLVPATAAPAKLEALKRLFQLKD
jgi:hypothetical protein